VLDWRVFPTAALATTTTRHNCGKSGIKAGSQNRGDCVVSGKIFKDAWRIRE
jgi:hypothetical protein